MREIQLTKEQSEKLISEQQAVAQAQAKVLELAIVLAAYGAVPTSLQNAVKLLDEQAVSRDESIKAVAAAHGIELDSADEAGKWSWSPQDGLLKRAE